MVWRELFDEQQLVELFPVFPRGFNPKGRIRLFKDWSTDPTYKTPPPVGSQPIFTTANCSLNPSGLGTTPFAG